MSETKLNVFFKGYLGILLIVLIVAFAPELRETHRSLDSMLIRCALCAIVTLAVYSIFYFVFRRNDLAATGEEENSPQRTEQQPANCCTRKDIGIFRCARLDKLPHIFIAVTAMLVILYPERPIQEIIAYGFRLIGYLLCVALAVGLVQAVCLSIKARRKTLPEK